MKLLLPLFTLLLLSATIGLVHAGISVTITDVTPIVNTQGEIATYTVNIESITTETENLQLSVIHHQDLQLNWTYMETVLATGATKNFGLEATYTGTAIGNLAFTVFGEAWPVSYNYSQAINLGLLETSSYTTYVYVPPPPTATPSPTPSPTPTTLPATTDTGKLVELIISGNVISSQMSNVAIATNQSASTTTLSFTVTGESGTTGFGNITIPKSAVPYGTTPTIYIDDQPAQDQGTTQDANSFYVWYTIHFSTHEVSIVFTTTAPSPSPIPQSGLPQEVIYGAVAAIAIVVIVAVVFVSRKAKNKKQQSAS